MGGEHLFEERGAGARETQDENGLRGIGAGSGNGEGGDALAGEEAFEARGGGFGVLGLVGGAGGFAQAGLAGIVGGEGFREAADLVEQAAFFEVVAGAELGG